MTEYKYQVYGYGIIQEYTKADAPTEIEAAKWYFRDNLNYYDKMFNYKQYVYVTDLETKEVTKVHFKFKIITEFTHLYSEIQKFDGTFEEAVEEAEKALDIAEIQKQGGNND